MATLGRERIKACRRRKYFLLDGVFFEVAKQLWSKPRQIHHWIPFFLFFLSLYVYASLYVYGLKTQRTVVLNVCSPAL